MKPACLGIIVLFCSIGAFAQSAAQPAPQATSMQRVPVIYSTDLFHPHDDPDDHFDLATLFAIPEFDIRAVLLDLGERQKERPGRVPLEQLFTLSGKRSPYATGLSAKLQSPSDSGRDQPAEDQAAIELLIKTLRESPEPVTVITAGSLRDVCAAFNREPELLRKKIARLYINIGNADGGEEWNVNLGQHAYVGVMRSGLPVYWCPCLPFGGERSTYWKFNHPDVLDTAPEGLKNFFTYALQRVPTDLIDPQAALKMDLRPWRPLVWAMQRNMWCTASFLHAAGYTVAKMPDGRYVPVPPGTNASELSAEPADVFDFVPAHVEINDQGQTRTVAEGAKPNMHAFHAADIEVYARAMGDCLARLLAEFDTAGR